MKRQENGGKHALGITPKFNVALFLFSMALGVFRFLLSDKAADVPVEGLVLSTAIDMVRFIVVLFLTAYFVREFWNRLVVSLFGLRTVFDQEAIAFLLILSILGA